MTRCKSPFAGIIYPLKQNIGPGCLEKEPHLPGDLHIADDHGSFLAADTAILTADAPQFLHVFHVILLDYLGRSPVLLLSVISGVLLVSGMSRPSLPPIRSAASSAA